MQLVVIGKHIIPESPSLFVSQPTQPTHQSSTPGPSSSIKTENLASVISTGQEIGEEYVQIRKVGVLLPNETFTTNLSSEFGPDATCFIQPILSNSQEFDPQQVTASGNSISITNNTTEPIIYGPGKDMEAILITKTMPAPQPEESINHLSEESRNYVPNQPSKYIPDQNYILPKSSSFSPPDPESYLSKITLDPDNRLSPVQLQQLKDINFKFKEVFDNDLRVGYNGASGPNFADWNWVNETKPPVHLGRVPIYSNQQDKQLLQDRIDWLFEQNIVDKAYHYGPIKYSTSCMLVVKPAYKDHPGPRTHLHYRFVQLFNTINDYIEVQPSQPETIQESLYEVGQYDYVIRCDLSNSFNQRWVAKRKIPYQAFHSPYKGMYVLLRSGQGMKNQSEGQDQFLFQVFGDLIQRGMCKKIHDDIYVFANSLPKLLENWSALLERLLKNNIKLDPKKVKCMEVKSTILGWEKEGRFLKPSSHRILALKHYPLPKTIKGLRSYLGLYRTFYPCLEEIAKVLAPLEELTGSKASKDEISISESYVHDFKASQLALDNVSILYCPSPNDQLAITLDWSKIAIGATLWAIIDKTRRAVNFFSAKLTEAQTKWPSCDGEGLAAAASIHHFAMYIRESSKATLVLSDNKPVIQAANLLATGRFSVSPRLNGLLACINAFHIKFQHISAKLGLNTAADFISRSIPITCTDEKCSTCKFIKDSCDSFTNVKPVLPSDTVAREIMSSETNYSCDMQDCQTCNFTNVCNALEESMEILSSCEIEAIIKGTLKMPFITKEGIKKLQEEDPDCSQVLYYLTTGTRPNKNNNKVYTIKRYLNKVEKNKDGLLVHRKYLPNVLQQLELPVIPVQFLPGILFATHQKLKHPLPSQHKKAANHTFFALDIDNEIENIYQNCFVCNAMKKIPAEVPDHSTSEPPLYPGSNWGCDVLILNGKKIVVSTDNVSSFTSTCFTPNENQQSLENAILSTITPFKSVSIDSSVRVDTAPGLGALIRKPDNLAQMGIHLDPGRVKNKNSLAIVDRRMQELRRELRIVCPEGKNLNQLQLSKATSILNERILSHGLSAREVFL